MKFSPWCELIFYSVNLSAEKWRWLRYFIYSKTSINRTLLFQKAVRFSKISVYTKCRIAPANRTKFGLGGGFSDIWTCKPNMKARKLHANPNIVQIAPRLTEICSIYVKARK